MSTRFTRVLFGFVLLAAAVAQAKVVYVVPNGAGAKDGTSWGDAYSSVHDAYASAADGATAEAPGEVWIKKGWYTLPAEQNARFQLKPYVKIFGGFSGDETIADQADPANNQTVLCAHYNPTDSTKCYWADPKNAGKGAPWSNVNGSYIYTSVPEDAYWHANGTGYDVGFTDADSAAPGCVMRGLVFTCWMGNSGNHIGIMSLSKPETTIAFRDCRFLANYRSANIGGTASAVFENCRFEGCCGPVYATASSTLVVSNCQFVSCYARGAGAGGVTVSSTGAAKIVNCSFERDHAAGNEQSMDVNAGSLTEICDCTFVNSQVFGGYGQPCITAAMSGQVDISRCIFVGARSSCNVDAGAASACIRDWTSGTSLIVRDSYFANNYFEGFGDQSSRATAFYYRSWGCILGLNDSTQNPVVFVNCTMVSNTVVSATTGKTPHVSLMSGGYTKRRLAIANCVFKDNDSFRVTTTEGIVSTNRIAAFDFAGSSSSFRMQNTIITHSAKDYAFFIGNTPGMRSMCVTGYTGFSAGSKTLLSCDPKLAEVPETNGNVTAWGLALGSPCRKIGECVWEGSDRNLYIYDPAGNAEKPWASLFSLTRISDTDAADVGVSLAAASVPDAFGEVRNPNRVALGPLNAPVSGLMLLLR